MENTSTRKPNINNKSGLHFNIGLVISLSLSIFAFEYKTPFDKEIMKKGLIKDIFEPYTDIPIIEIKPPAPPLKIQVPVPTDEPDIEVPPLQLDIENIIDPNSLDIPDEIVPEDISESIKDFAQVLPQYSGGLSEYYSYLKKNLRYPYKAKKLGVEGKVFIQFVVNTDGTISEVVLLRGIGAGCDEEAIRVISGSTNWQPGKQNGDNVRVRMVVPITFKLH